MVRGQDLEEPLGVAHKRDIADALLAGAPLDLAAMTHEPIYIPVTTSLLVALERFKESRLHMGFVINEYGGFEGVLTPTDLLEMIAGDLNEGHDDDRLMIVRREDGSFLVDGRADLVELGDAIGEDFETGAGFHTVAGLILHKLGRFPKEGEIVTLGRFKVEIVDMDERRIDKLLFHNS